mgnify:FL=1
MFGFLKALARNSDPITSDEAAELVHVEHVEGVIVRHLKFWPAGLTCIELAGSTGLAMDSISPRMVKLEEKGLIYRDGTRRVRGARSATTVWKAVTHG